MPLRPKSDSSQPTVSESHHAPGDVVDASNELLRGSRVVLVFVVRGVGESKLRAKVRQLLGAGYLPVPGSQNLMAHMDGTYVLSDEVGRETEQLKGSDVNMGWVRSSFTNRWVLEAL